MTTRNPKQEGSNLYDCKPQTGPCPLKCNQCFYNRDGAFYVDIHQPHMPDPKEVGDGIMRVNCGHDSNIDKEKAIEETEIYKNRFFNTSIPNFDFPAPVVWTANRAEELAVPVIPIPVNMMFIRLRVSSTNWQHIEKAIREYSKVVPAVLTFMAYYDEEPHHKQCYTWKTRHLNSYWCPTKKFMQDILKKAKAVGGRAVSLCSDFDTYKCSACKNCETYYWQTIKHIKERVL